MDHVYDKHVIMQYVSDLVDDRVLDPLFLNGLAMAALILFGAGTLVIVVCRAVFAGSAFPEHQRLAIPAEQLGGQQIIVLRLMPDGSLFVLGQLFLYPIEKVFGNDGRDTVWDGDLAV